MRVMSTALTLSLHGSRGVLVLAGVVDVYMEQCICPYGFPEVAVQWNRS